MWFSAHGVPCLSSFGVREIAAFVQMGAASFARQGGDLRNICAPGKPIMTVGSRAGYCIVAAAWERFKELLNAV